MTLRPILVTLLLSLSALGASAQTMPRLQTIQPAPAVSEAAVVDKDAQLERLQDSNRRLRAENQELQARLDAMTRKGGSAVMAYCENPSESRNTAGAVDACGDYTCNETSGLCRDRCTTSLHCGFGTSCIVEKGTCEPAPGE
jgi:uncharacterized protein YlxW (UPF0749 family)